MLLYHVNNLFNVFILFSCQKGAGIIDTHCQLDDEYTFRNGYPMMVHFGGITPDSDKAIHEHAVNCLARQIRFALRTEEEQQALANKAVQSSSSQAANAWTKVSE